MLQKLNVIAYFLLLLNIGLTYPEDYMFGVYYELQSRLTFNLHLNEDMHIKCYMRYFRSSCKKCG